MTLERERRAIRRLGGLDHVVQRLEGREDPRALERLRARMESTGTVSVATLRRVPTAPATTS